MPSTGADAPLFTRVDWDSEASAPLRPRRRTLGFAAALLALAALFAYDYTAAPNSLVWSWDLTRMDWLSLLAGVVGVRYGVVPLVADRDRTAPYVVALLRQPAVAFSVSYLFVFGVLGVVGPETFGYARVDFTREIQPPVYTSVSAEGIPNYGCVGEMVGERCHGTWQYPLGTTRVGEDVAKFIVYGMHIALKLALSAGILMVVVATTVGTTAGYFGGWVDDVLMWYVDIQQSIPAIVVYLIVAYTFLDDGLFTLALVFGLFDWGGIARLVRSETLKRRSAGYVRAARSAGASHLHVVRNHVVPNAADTIVTALTRQIPVLILIQVALSYLQLNTVNLRSLGEMLTRGLSTNPVPWFQRWWVTASVVVFLVLTVVSFNLVGDAVGDVLNDPEEVR